MVAPQFFTGSRAGQLILQAAQGIIAQRQQQERMELQQAQFDQQVKMQERTFQLREQQFTAQQKQLQAEQAAFEAQGFAGRAGAEAANTRSLIESRGARPPGGGLTAEQRRLALREVRTQESLKQLNQLFVQNGLRPVSSLDQAANMRQGLQNQTLENNFRRLLRPGAQGPQAEIARSTLAELEQLRGLEQSPEFAQEFGRLLSRDLGDDELLPGLTQIVGDEQIARQILAAGQVDVAQQIMTESVIPDTLSGAVDAAKTGDTARLDKHMATKLTAKSSKEEYRAAMDALRQAGMSDQEVRAYISDFFKKVRQ